jgi:hypothetical protein
MEMRAAAGYLVGGVPGGGGLGLHRAPGGRAPGREVGGTAAGEGGGGETRAKWTWRRRETDRSID